MSWKQVSFWEENDLPGVSLAVKQGWSRYLFAEGVHHVHPVVLGGVVAVDGFRQTARHVDEVVEGHGGDAALSDGDVGP